MPPGGIEQLNIAGVFRGTVHESGSLRKQQELSPEETIFYAISA